MSTLVRRLYGGIAVGAILSGTGLARAEGTADADKARGLFKEARALVAEGKYADACPKFEQSLKLDEGIGTKFNLADCYEHVGRTATAQTLFLEVAAVARQAGQADREHAAEARAKSLEPQLHTLRIDVKGKQGGLTVLRDGVEVPPAKWGAPQPVDPGTYEIRVTAEGKKPWSQRVEVPRSGDATIEIPELEDEGAAKEVVAVAVAPAPETPKKSDPPPDTATDGKKSGSSDIVVPLIIYGGLGVGAILGTTGLILYKSANDKAEAICKGTENSCPEEEKARHDDYVNDAKSARTLAYVGLGVAGAAVITGVAIALFRPKPEKPNQASFSTTPIIAPGLYGATMSLRF